MHPAYKEKRHIKKKKKVFGVIINLFVEHSIPFIISILCCFHFPNSIYRFT